MPKPPRSILGVNAYHADASAALWVDGQLVAAVEEERLNRIKHWAGFPRLAIAACLEAAGMRAAEIEHVAVNRNPGAARRSRLAYVLRNRPHPRLIADRLRHRHRARNLREDFGTAFGPMPQTRFHAIGHHHAHVASAFAASAWDDAAIASVDGFGDFASAAWGLGRGNRIEIRGSVPFPHSLGIFYQALTQFLGFDHYGEEYKVMGLAAWGEPRFADSLRRLVRAVPGGYRLDLRWFRHAREPVELAWDNTAPHVGQLFHDRLRELLGPARRRDEALTDRHRDLACSVQQVYEEVLFAWLRELAARTGRERLCLAGGCAMNSVANGRIREQTPFRELYVPPSPGDGGGAVGAIAVLLADLAPEQARLPMPHAAWGPPGSPADLERALDKFRVELDAIGAHRERMADEAQLAETVADAIANGAVVGWFQGRMEWGPRALGQRSILADPRRPDMQQRMNAAIKRRESFRPFAPAVLAEAADEWFEQITPVPFMSQVLPVRPGQRARIPAVTHVDGSGRLQTVDEHANPRYRAVITAFGRRTGVPMLLNTSFNENEPIVASAIEAIDCFLRTQMDMLVLENRIVRRNPTDATLAQPADSGSEGT